MKHIRSAAFAVVLAMAAVLTSAAQDAAPPPEVPDPHNPQQWYRLHDQAAAAYLDQYIVITDFFVGWLPAAPNYPQANIPPLHCARGRVVNTGNQVIHMTAIEIQLLDAAGNTLETLSSRLCPESNPQATQVNPGEACIFYEPLPPTNGVSPRNWTGEVRAVVEKVILKDFH